eukprot:CAMPEP_0113455824 /NCGR_PEP_ID=MMETSP0014_2-20120614/8572_1 /TAXON_ID=2857 /ORGANISM="Nitzschia sp." /LENGTH=639 /DNA_ID=CAMNT_0000347261 /DNA_START=413 /DNA_END=2332 /DNA_ORIENTATION=- /assembly_acc=CAM_ASM_000159
MVRNFVIIVASVILTSSAFFSVVQPAEGTSSNSNNSNSNTNNRKSHLRRKRLAENVGLLMQVDGAVDSSTSKKKGSSTHNAAAAAVHKTPSVAGGGRKDRGRDLAAADEEFGREQKQKQQRRHNQERKQRKSIRQDKELSDAIASAEEVLRDLFDDNRYLQVVSMSMSMVGGRTEDSSSASYNSQEDIYSSSSGARVPTSPFDGRLDKTPTQITSDEEVVEEDETEEEETPPTTDDPLDTPPETTPSTPSDTTVEVEAPEEAIGDGQMIDTPETPVSEGAQDNAEEVVTEEETTDGGETPTSSTPPNTAEEVEAEGQTDELDTPETPTLIPSDTTEQEEPADGLLNDPETPSSIPSNTTGQETNIDVQPSTNSTTQEEEVQEDISSSEATVGASPSSSANDTATAVGEELDVDRFDVVLTYQNEPGVCSGSASGIGCAGEASGSDMGGNPNTLLNCYDVTSFTTIDESDATAEGTSSSTIVELKEVTFWIGESSDLPRDLSVRVWDSVDGTIASGPNNLLFEQDVLEYSAGENTIFLDVATGDDSLIPENGVVCVGVYSESVEDGLRIQTESPPADDSGAPVDPVGSFLMTPSCGLTDFTSLSDLTVRGGLCIEAIVSVTTTTASSAASAESSVETGKL